MKGGRSRAAFLAADAATLPQLTERLGQQRTPAVAGVTVRESMLASFFQTIAQSMTATNSVLILFACIIAFGIIYNGARISLSSSAAASWRRCGCSVSPGARSR